MARAQLSQGLQAVCRSLLLPPACDRPEPPALSPPSSLRGPAAPQAHLHASRMLATHDLPLFCLLPSAVLWDTALCPGRFLRLNAKGRSKGGNEGQGRTWEKAS